MASKKKKWWSRILTGGTSDAVELHKKAVEVGETVRKGATEWAKRATTKSSKSKTASSASSGTTGDSNIDKMIAVQTVTQAELDKMNAARRLNR